MPPLSPTQIALVRRQLGQWESLFTDEQLQAFAEDAYLFNPDTYLYGTIANAFYQLAFGKIELTDYKQGETTDNEAVIYNRFKQWYEAWAAKAGYLDTTPKATIQRMRLHDVVLPEDCDYA